MLRCFGWVKMTMKVKFSNFRVRRCISTWASHFLVSLNIFMLVAALRAMSYLEYQQCVLKLLTLYELFLYNRDYLEELYTSQPGLTPIYFFSDLVQ